MRFRVRWAVAFAFLLPLTLSAQADAQAGDGNRQIDDVIARLFAAMRAADTAAVRAAFAGNARVIPIQPNGAANTLGQGLAVDQFVAFAGRNGPGVWIERVWNPVQRLDGPLADVWFAYDVYRGAVFDHCGVNSVQLQETTSGWKIVSMAFTSATRGCAAHPPPAP